MKWLDGDLESYECKSVHESVLQYGDAAIVPAAYLLIEIEGKKHNRTDDHFLQEELLRTMADDYLGAADALLKSFLNTFESTDNGDYATVEICDFIPICFLCHHAIELKLKEILCRKNLRCFHEHKVYKELFNKFDWSDFKDERWYIQVEKFLKDTSVDDDGFCARYGFDRNGKIYASQAYMFNPKSFVFNTKYLFDVFDKYGDEFKLR